MASVPCENFLYVFKAARSRAARAAVTATPPPPAGAPGGRLRTPPDGWRGRVEAGRRATVQVHHRAVMPGWNSRQCRAAHGDASGGGRSGSGTASNACAGGGVAGAGVHPAHHRPQASPADRLLRRKPGCDRWRPMTVEGAQAEGHVRPGLHLRRRPAAAPRWGRRQTGWTASVASYAGSSGRSPKQLRGRNAAKRQNHQGLDWRNPSPSRACGLAGCRHSRLLVGIVSRHRSIASIMWLRTRRAC